ncbi:hypothetical protein EJB05_01903, partial [Eragrostis curvula]
MKIPSGEEGGGGGKKPKGEAATAVAAVGDDLLGDIFLRLPDTASLARAALACKRWRRVASERALLRRFHSLHRPPFLGVILFNGGDTPVPYGCPDLRFVPMRSRNPHLAAAAAAGDFYFNDLPESDSEFDDEGRRYIIRRDPWMLRGCDGGLLLLSRRRCRSEELAVYDPFARTAVFFRGLAFDFDVVNYAFFADEADTSFRVFAAQFFDDGGYSAAVYSSVYCSRTKEWSPLLPSCRAPYPWNERDGMRAGRFAYWQSNTRKCYVSSHKERVVVLDTSTMEWSLHQVPFPVGQSYCAADMGEYGGLCLVGAKEQCLQLWANTDGGWVKKKQVSLLTQFPFLKKIRREEWMKRVRPLAVRGDYVFMEFWSIRKSHSYILLLNLKTMKLEIVKNNSREPLLLLSICCEHRSSERWRRVASDRALLRRFHSLHRPPLFLLGVILSDRGDMPVPYRCPNLRFVPVRSGNSHLAASGDFFFYDLPENDSDDDRKYIIRDPWMLRGCDGGLLLLSRGRNPREDLAVYDPFARTAVFFRGPDFPLHAVNYAFLADEVDASFRVVAAQFFDDRVYAAAAYCSRTKEWSPLPSHRAPYPWNSRDGVRAGRFAYWQSNTRKYWDSNDRERVMVLDTTTMEWSLHPVPFPVGESYCAADMAEHGGLCLVGANEQSLQLWASADGGWVKKQQVSLLTQFPFLKKIRREEWMKRVRPLAVRGDCVLMEFWSIRKSHSYILSLNLKTMKLEMVKNNSNEPYRGSAFPFFVSWVSPLLSPGI